MYAGAGVVRRVRGGTACQIAPLTHLDLRGEAERPRRGVRLDRRTLRRLADETRYSFSSPGFGVAGDAGGGGAGGGGGEKGEDGDGGGGGGASSAGYLTRAQL